MDTQEVVKNMLLNSSIKKRSILLLKASMKVAESIGMKKEDEFITQFYNGDMLHYLYSVYK